MSRFHVYVANNFDSCTWESRTARVVPSPQLLFSSLNKNSLPVPALTPHVNDGSADDQDAEVLDKVKILFVFDGSFKTRVGVTDTPGVHTSSICRSK